MVRVIVIACVKIETPPRMLSNRTVLKGRRRGAETTQRSLRGWWKRCCSRRRKTWLRTAPVRGVQNHFNTKQIVGGVDGGFHWYSTCRFQVRWGRFGAACPEGFSSSILTSLCSASAGPHRVFLRSICCSASTLHLNWWAQGKTTQLWPANAATCGGNATAYVYKVAPQKPP